MCIAATRYQKGARYIVRDDKTREILQISGDNYNPPEIPTKKYCPKLQFLKEVDMNSGDIIEIYVQLFDEGVPTARPTKAIYIGNELYRVLPTPDYDPEDEVWEFLPGSLVRCKVTREGWAREMLLAVEKVN